MFLFVMYVSGDQLMHAVPFYTVGECTLDNIASVFTGDKKACKIVLHAENWKQYNSETL